MTGTGHLAGWVGIWFFYSSGLGFGLSGGYRLIELDGFQYYKWRYTNTTIFLSLQRSSQDYRMDFWPSSLSDWYFVWLGYYSSTGCPKRYKTVCRIDDYKNKWFRDYRWPCQKIWMQHRVQTDLYSGTHFRSRHEQRVQGFWCCWLGLDMNLLTLMGGLIDFVLYGLNRNQEKKHIWVEVKPLRTQRIRGKVQRFQGNPQFGRRSPILGWRDKTKWRTWVWKSPCRNDGTTRTELYDWDRMDFVNVSYVIPGLMTLVSKDLQSKFKRRGWIHSVTPHKIFNTE